MTGINSFQSEIDAKRLGLMHELLPKAKRVAVLVNPANPKTADTTARALREAAPSLGLELLLFNASTAGEIDAAFAAIVEAKAEAVFIAPDGFSPAEARNWPCLHAVGACPPATSCTTQSRPAC